MAKAYNTWPTVFVALIATPVLMISGPLLLSPPDGLNVSTFATGLNFPTSVTPLTDGSLLVGTTTPFNTTGQFAYYFGSGELVRLASSTNNGVSDSSTVVYAGLPGAVTSVRQIGPLIAVATVGNTTAAGLTQGDITFLKPGATPTAPYTNVGSIHLQETVNTLTVLPLAVSPGSGGSYSVYFGVGANNTGTPTGTVSLSGLITAANQPTGSIYQMTVNTNGATPTVSGLTQVANGIRNTGGILVDPATGNVYFGDNGYEDSGGVPISADELNMLTAAQIASGTATSFGYPNSYTNYSDGSFAGGTGVPPLWSYLGQSFGLNEIAFMPSGFPVGLNNGILGGFDGNYNHSGTLNPTNPVVLYDLGTNTSSDFVGGGQADVGHLIGLASTGNSLFLADISSADGWIPGSGVIYEITAADVSSVPEPASAALVLTGLALALIRVHRSNRSSPAKSPASPAKS
jgi:glucose/arabinose dehydrogenase